METFTQRLSLLRGNSSQIEFAKFLGIEQTYISRYELGKVKPTSEFLSLLVEKTNVNLNWLLTGKGDMYITSNETKSELLKEIAELKRDKRRINETILSQVAVLTKLVNAAEESKKIVK
jgi:transcriptional regulator with XRE-family HTH domain